MVISDKITIPDWISTKVYDDESDSVIAFAINEITKELLIFEDLPAKIWNLILRGASVSDIYSFAKDNDADDEIEEFLSSITDFLSKESEDGNVQNLSNTDETKSGSNECFSDKNFGEINTYLKKGNKLFDLTLELTYKCNLKCIHCYNEKEDFSSFISFENAKKIIDEADETGIYAVTLTGGEATLNNDFLKIAKYVRSRRLSLNIFTNAQALYDDRNLLNEIIKLYPHSVCISLYSMNQDVHDSITGVKNSFEKTISVFNYLKENNIATRINCFVMKDNFSGIDEVYNFAQENGSSAIFDVRFINNESRHNSELQLTEEQLISFYTKYFGSEKCSPRNNNTDDFMENGICSAGIKSFVVTPQLYLIPCNPFKLRLGDLNKQSLKSIYYDKDETTTLNKWRNTKIKHISGCYKDDYCSFCYYCPAVDCSNTLDLKKSETLCNIAKAKMAVNMRKKQ